MLIYQGFPTYIFLLLYDVSFHNVQILQKSMTFPFTQKILKFFSIPCPPRDEGMFCNFENPLKGPIFYFSILL